MDGKNKKYVLYADDDVDDHMFLRDIVIEKMPDLDIIACEHGMQLLQWLEKLSPEDRLPCCIILDINMPVLSGIQTLNILKSHAVFKAIPVIMFTTSSSAHDAQQSLLLGAESFLTKPFDYRQFQVIADKFLLFCKGE